ncbi:hypothetical protein FC96_GL000541 [Secundilactobacillus kimchicus JCM 15530]|uniref:Uncharacterized protein n=1 Tax=Secundilactobacillus kimchicus JCM 15530 TaxID=1302272 RepID=A0A0R1HWV1_9LACO|nr:hypothetical protein [Secundilactobacillus kimchicus]KRK47271.1 hypothetical protein FC96_GL000541 [Secundilactobacillus kimchicus JCM 15530]
MTFSFLLFSSTFGFTVVGNTQAQATETPTAVVQNVKTSTPKAHATFTTSVKSINQVVQADDYATAITQEVNWINTQVAAEKLTGWDALALVRSSTGITDAQKTQIQTNIETNYADPSTQHQPTDYARDVIGLICVGADPTNVNGQNLVQEAVTNGIAADADVYAVTYGLIAATAAQSSNLGNVQTADLQIMVTNLLGMQNSETGYWTDQYGYTLDTTGMALQALALYLGNSEFDTDGRITNAVNSAFNTITLIGGNGALQEDGNFKDPFVADAAVNSSSDAMLIAGLAACGTELPDESPLSALLSFQVLHGTDAGSFNWTPEMTYDRQLSTQQAVYALDQYSYSVDGKGSIFDFTANPVN